MRLKEIFARWVLRRDHKEGLAVGLAALFILAIIVFQNPFLLLPGLMSIITAIILELLLAKIIRQKIYFPLAAIVTSLLVILILDHTAPLATFVTASALAILSKYIFKWKGQHIFNPAGFGLIAAALLTGRVLSWWGTSYSVWPALIILFGAGFTLWRARRWPMVLGFLIVYALYFLLVTKNLSVTFDLIFNGSLLLFAMVMLPEPKTTPGVGFWGKYFGVLVGLIFVVLTSVPWRLTPLDPLILSLLIGDLLSFLIIKISPATGKGFGGEGSQA